MYTKFMLDKFKDRAHLEDLGVDGIIIIKYFVKSE
jgi:hypothetical protein